MPGFSNKMSPYSEHHCDFQRFVTYFLIKIILGDAIIDVFAELFRTKYIRTAKIIAIFSDNDRNTGEG